MSRLVGALPSVLLHFWVLNIFNFLEKVVGPDLQGLYVATPVSGYMMLVGGKIQSSAQSPPRPPSPPNNKRSICHVVSFEWCKSCFKTLLYLRRCRWITFYQKSVLKREIL